jgi:low affinity Fe/Cu permease
MQLDQVVFNWAVAVAGFLGGWVLKVIWDAITDLKKDIRAMDTKMHEDFVRRDDFKDAMAEHKQDMQQGFREIKDLIGVLFKKLDSKQDK